MSTEHLGVAWHLIPCYSHSSDHLSWLTLEEPTTAAYEDCVASEDASVDLLSHLVALYILSQVLLTFSRSLDRLE